MLLPGHRPRVGVEEAPQLRPLITNHCHPPRGTVPRRRGSGESALTTTAILQPSTYKHAHIKLVQTTHHVVQHPGGEGEVQPVHDACDEDGPQVPAVGKAGGGHLGARQAEEKVCACIVQAGGVGWGGVGTAMKKVFLGPSPPAEVRRAYIKACAAAQRTLSLESAIMAPSLNTASSTMSSVSKYLGIREKWGVGG